jgi:hypothetical protein
MTADLHIDYDSHLKRGNVWRIEVGLPMQDSPDDVPDSIDVTVDVVAPNRDLAQYIVATMYPDYSYLCVPDDPLS